MAERSQTAPEADSDLGNDDAIGGNVSKHAVLPVGYCGQLKKGHLVFDACFESGNLGRVDQVSEFEYDLFIRPDTCNPRFRVWFNFTVENVRESQVGKLSLRPLQQLTENYTISGLEEIVIKPVW
ncbi:cytosolic carboxypeptidase 6-like isoform X2 [Oryctolagus cuniculus]|uniref:cytosolic carboxypeptidase 6-like isoform X2 n=1 Tax=Oryctolagus cuniculus TaxID=9986 RepID=UPI00387A1071